MDNGQCRSIVVTCNFLTINFFCDYQLKRGALGPIRNRKTVVKIIQYRKTEKNSIKTENRRQNCRNRYIFISQLLKPWSIRFSGDKWSVQSKLH